MNPYGEEERSPPDRVPLGPETTTVVLDDGPADRQPHSQALRLCGEEGLEHGVLVLLIDSDSTVLHRYCDAIGLLFECLYDHLPRAVPSGNLC